MPFKSKGQRRKFAELLVPDDISPATFEEWNRETRILPLALAAIALAGCSREPVMCTMEARPALAVTVVDSATGAGLAAITTVIAREAAFSDTLRGIDSTLSGVYERAGTYRVELTSPGYRDWVTEGVTVEKDQCHVLTVKLRAPLARQ